MGRRKKTEKRVETDGGGFGGSFGDLLRAQGLAPAEPAPTAAAPADDVVVGGSTGSGPTADDLSPLGKLVVRRTRKGRGGRWVSLIEGLADLPSAERDALAAAARKALGTGARVEDEAVVVQGDVGERLADWLRARGARRVIVS